jgi:hypothetical protein
MISKENLLTCSIVRNGENMNRTKIAEMIETRLDKLVTDIRAELEAVVQAELRGAFGVGGATNGRRSKAVPARRAVKRWSPKTCIKPGCNNPPNGPRFHYLCKTHQDAPKKDWEAWRKTADKAREPGKKKA